MPWMERKIKVTLPDGQEVELVEHYYVFDLLEPVMPGHAERQEDES